MTSNINYSSPSPL
jgi:hypothetical protein